MSTNTSCDRNPIGYAASRIAAAILVILAISLSVLMPVAPPGIPLQAETAHAAITIGGGGDDPVTLDGYEPEDVISTDLQVNVDDPSEVSGRLENTLIKLIRLFMPFIMLGCVAIIIGNAVANIFRPKEKRVAMGDVIKNMVVQFFFILFAFIIVEAIVFVVTGGQALLFSTVLG